MSLKRLSIVGLLLPLALSACDNDPCGSPELADEKALEWVERRRDLNLSKITSQVERDTDACYYTVTGRARVNEPMLRDGWEFNYRVVLRRDPPGGKRWDPLTVENSPLEPPISAKRLSRAP